MKKNKEKTTKDEPVPYEGEMGSYKVLKEFPFTDEHGTQMGQMEVGSVQNLPVELALPLVEEGLLEVVETPVASEETTVSKEESTDEIEKKSYYRGVLITTEIEDIMHYGHPYKKFSIETKESLMLSPEEFAADVTTK